MSILLLTPHFSGHRLAIDYLSKVLNEHLAGDMCGGVILHTFNHTNNTSTFPMDFVFENVCKNVRHMMQSYDFSKILAIVYDFFSIEGIILSKITGVPCICSIPAILSDKINVVVADDVLIGKLECIEKEFGVKLPPPRLVSDGFLLEGDENLVWGFKSIYERYIPNVTNNVKYHFVGSKCQSTVNANIKKMPSFTDPNNNKYVFCSFGTVVVGSKSLEFDDILPKIYQKIIDMCNSCSFQLILVCPTRIYEKLSNKQCVKYQSEYCDQEVVLKNAMVFITHGGGNSFHESIIRKCPMLTIPFFGDQFETASYVNNCKFGIAFKSYSDFLETDFDVTCFNLLSAIEINTEDFPEQNINLNKAEIIRTVFKFSDPTKLFNSGDLLYGTTIDREHFDSTYNLNFHIAQKDHISNKFITFDKLMLFTNLQYPVLIDQWNDLLKEYNLDQLHEIEQSTSNMRLKKVIKDAIKYKQYLNVMLGYDMTNPIVAEDRQLLDICCEGMEYFLGLGSKIHFVFRKFKKSVNIGTLLELNRMKSLITAGKYSQQFVIWIYDEITGKYLITSQRSVFNNMRHDIDIKLYTSCYDSSVNRLTKFINIISSEYPVLVQHRLKSSESINNNVLDKILSPNHISDIIGIRIIYVWTKGLHAITEKIINQNVFHVVRTEFREKNKVIYLHCITNQNLPLEIQMWPTIMYTCFEYEHDKLYKPVPNCSYTSEQGKIVLEKEHQLQDIVDRFEIF